MTSYDEGERTVRTAMISLATSAVLVIAVLCVVGLRCEQERQASFRACVAAGRQPVECARAAQ